MDWNARYRKDDTPWDKGGPAPILEELLTHRSALFQNVAHALAPGCGLGHDPFLLAKNGIRTTGSDISEIALKQARTLYQHPQLDWLQADLFCDLAKAHYDMVWEHTCFCAIPPATRDSYVEAMANTIKPGGFLLGIFFTETGKREDEGPPFKASQETIKSHFFKHFSLEYQMKPTVSYPGREGREHLMLFRRLHCCLD